VNAKAAMSRPRVRVPKTVRRGEPFEIKALIAHAMESGQRKDEATGRKIPRKIINAFVCKLDGVEIFRARLHPAVAANPYFAFYATAEKSGELELTWTDDDGSTLAVTERIEVSD
jgi:sulfur-oxidizing protein SoxZ